MRTLPALLLLSLAACQAPALPGEGQGQVSQCADEKCDTTDLRPEAICEVRVRGHGVLDVEDHYLAHVIACENYNAPPESLLAQAIAARSWLYVELQRQSGVDSGENDQVYSCSLAPQPRHFEAVTATRGLVLGYNNTVVQSFYVAGAPQSSSDCDGNRWGAEDFHATHDSHNTERFVTYNEGLSGSAVEQSRQGTVDEANYANRGTMSQNGANCLAAHQNMNHQDILKYYYGNDIEIVQAEGECIGNAGPVDPNPAPTDPQALVDVGRACQDDAQCGDDAPAGSCYKYFIDSTDTNFGVCKQACTDTDCPSGSACVQLGTEGGSCMAVPSQQNNYCESIPGTIPRVLGKPFAGAAAGDWRSVCAPPQFGTSCRVNASVKGECVNTDSITCTGTLVQGVCPGSEAVQCCVR